jgi:hypothetical protein
MDRRIFHHRNIAPRIDRRNLALSEQAQVDTCIRPFSESE